MKKAISLIMVLALTAGIMCGGVSAAGSNASKGETQYVNTDVDHTTYGWLLEDATIDAEGHVSVKIMEVPGFQTKEYTTVCSLTSEDNQSAVTSGVRGKALIVGLKKDAFAEVRFNADNECIDFELIEYGVPTYMDSASYGGELTAEGGYAGNMVAQGFILEADKDANTITIGDGNHEILLFEETYTLADDCQIYLVDNATANKSKSFNVPGTWDKLEDATFDDIKVCSKGENGEIYYVAEKYTVLCIFDSSYETSWKTGEAKVKELYLFANELILQDKDLSTPDGVTYNGSSWYPYAPMTEERVAVGFNGGTVPTEYMAGRLYDVGDNNTNIMMFIGDGGELTLLDMGNRLAAYQYYLKIEQCGYDPREVGTIFLTHGHVDHYEALYEFSAMVRRSGNNLTTMANGYIEGATVSNDEITVELTPMVSAQDVLYSVNTILEWDKWQYFMGEGTALYPYRAIGHSKDTTNFCFKLIAKEEDEFFDEGTVVGWFYQGGLGMINNVGRGAERLQFMNSLMYAQSKAAPWLAAQCDVTYFMDQHTLVYPYLEMDKGARMADVPLMSIVEEGVENISNVQENRVSMMMYQKLEDAYLAGEDLYNQLLKPYGVYDKAFKERGTYSIDTIEEHGPWKREGGEYDITIESVTVLHGFDGVFSTGEALRGQKNVYGWDMGDGVLVPWVSYSHDPDSWYVQVICSVNDDYNGCFFVDTNWYQGDYITHNKTADGTVVDKSSITEGLVEMGNDPYNWREVLRTERFDSKEEAEEFARKLTNGKYTTPYEAYTVNGDLLYTYDDVEDHHMTDYGNTVVDTKTYTVQLDKACNILLGDSFEQTFKEKVNDPYYNDAMQWASANSIITSTFNENAPCTRSQMVAYLWRAAGSPAPATVSAPFTDVTTDADYYNAVLWALENGITAGTSATTFSPELKVSRGQAMMFLYRMAGLPAVDGDEPFADVDADDYYRDAVTWAVAQEIISGVGDSAFGPDQNCTGGQVLTFLYRVKIK